MSFGNQEEINQIRMLHLLRQLRLIRPETYAKTIADNMDPMSMVQWEMEKMNHVMSKMLERAFVGVPLNKATGSTLEDLMEMSGLLSKVVKTE